MRHLIGVTISRNQTMDVLVAVEAEDLDLDHARDLAKAHVSGLVRDGWTPSTNLDWEEESGSGIDVDGVSAQTYTEPGWKADLEIRDEPDPDAEENPDQLALPEPSR